MISKLYKVFFFLILLPSLAYAGNERMRYIDENCANDGDGMRPVCAASAGGSGAANNVTSVKNSIEATWPSGLITPDVNVFGWCSGCTGGELGVQTLSIATDGSHRFFVTANDTTAQAEVCGNGIDDPWQTGGTANGTKGSCPGGYADAVWGNGCDKLCSTDTPHDKDHDGYTDDGSVGARGSTDVDCDDTDRRVQPGYYVPNSWSSPTGYKKCQTSGSYTSVVLNSTTPLCESPLGTSHCFYISSTGDNTNPGTYSSPFQTLGKVGGGNGGSPPASPVTLDDDDFVYLIGGGTLSTTYSWGSGGTSMLELAQNGSSGHPITIKKYPGATVILEPTTAQAISGSGNYISFDDLEIIPYATGIYNNNGDHWTMTRLYVHDPKNLNGNNNQNCVYCTNNNYCQITDSYFKNCFTSIGNPFNTGSIMWLDNDAVGDGAGHKGNFNTHWCSMYQPGAIGYANREKHGPNAADVGSAGHEVKFNTCVNMPSCFSWNGSGLRFMYNLVVNGGIGGIGDSAESNCEEDNIVEYNTVAGKGPGWSPGFRCSTDKLTLRYNIIKDPRTSWVNGNSEGIYTIGGYASDSQYNSIAANNKILSNYNGLYAGTALQFCLACQTSGGPGPAGPAGAFYTFSNWKSTEGYDLNSVNADPNYTADFKAQASGMESWGYLKGFESTGAPTPTPTPGATGGSGLVGRAIAQRRL